jgi:uncharacterized protein (TIGR03437 family)
VLDGISVSIDGNPAYVWYLSTGQLNVQAPEDTAIGNISIRVTNCNATSTPMSFARRALVPDFSLRLITRPMEPNMQGRRSSPMALPY